MISGCENGECRESTCVCKQGFALDKAGKLCEPVCDPPCGKGKCTAPNTCSCNVGYELTPSGACIPKCPNGCDFGECVAPDRCDCRPGFILQNTICSPVCEKCEFLISLSISTNLNVFIAFECIVFFFNYFLLCYDVV